MIKIVLFRPKGEIFLDLFFARRAKIFGRFLGISKKYTYVKKKKKTLVAVNSSGTYLIWAQKLTPTK